MTNEELVRLVRLLLLVWEECGQEAAEALLEAHNRGGQRMGPAVN